MSRIATSIPWLSVTAAMPQPWHPPDEAQVGDRVLDRDQLGVTRRATAIAGLICSSSTWITRWGTSPERSGGGQVRVATAENGERSPAGSGSASPCRR